MSAEQELNFDDTTEDMSAGQQVNSDDTVKGLKSLLEIDRQLEKLINQKQDEHSTIGVELAFFLSVRGELLVLLARDESSQVREEVARRSGNFTFLLEIFATDNLEEVLQDLAGKIRESQTILAKDEDRKVRQEVAHNLYVSSDTLAILAKDEDSQVKREVAKNLCTPAEALARLAKDEDKWVRTYTSSHRSTPTSVLASLAEDDERDVRDRVFKNPSTPDEVRQRLSETLKEKRKGFSLGGMKIPAKQLKQLANTKMQTISKEQAQS